jgi:hypothetical protein
VASHAEFVHVRFTCYGQVGAEVVDDGGFEGGLVVFEYVGGACCWDRVGCGGGGGGEVVFYRQAGAGVWLGVCCGVVLVLTQGDGWVGWELTWKYVLVQEAPCFCGASRDWEDAIAPLQAPRPGSSKHWE